MITTKSKSFFDVIYQIALETLLLLIKIAKGLIDLSKAVSAFFKKENRPFILSTIIIFIIISAITFSLFSVIKKTETFAENVRDVSNAFNYYQYDCKYNPNNKALLTHDDILLRDSTRNLSNSAADLGGILNLGIVSLVHNFLVTGDQIIYNKNPCSYIMLNTNLNVNHQKDVILEAVHNMQTSKIYYEQALTNIGDWRSSEYYPPSSRKNLINHPND